MKYEEFVKMDSQGEAHWWYEARRNLVLQQLKNICAKPISLKILDLASACGNNFGAYKDYGKIFGLDISWHAINYCKKKDISTIVQADAQKLPFKSGVFDIVLALDVFEHLEDDLASLKEISRVLKENGGLIFNTPAFMALYSYHDTAFHHFRRYSKYELKDKFTSTDLQIKKITYWSFFIFPVIYIFRRLFCRKIKNEEGSLSDFHRELNPVIEKFIKFLFNIELALIKKNVSLPFGVSLFGMAQKSSKNIIK